MHSFNNIPINVNATLTNVGKQFSGDKQKHESTTRSAASS